MIKLAVFDINGVLQSKEGLNEYFTKEFYAFLKRHNATEPADADVRWKRMESLIHKGKLTLREARIIELDLMGIPRKYLSEYEKIDEGQLKIVKTTEPGAKTALVKLRQMGCKVAALSDSLHPKKTVMKNLNKIGIGKMLDGVFLSSSIGYKKPHRKAYEAVLKYFKANPDETIFVGHDDDEMLGARRLGITAVSYRQSKKGDFLIGSLSALPELVEMLNKGGSPRRPK